MLISCRKANGDTIHTMVMICKSYAEEKLWISCNHTSQIVSEGEKIGSCLLNLCESHKQEADHHDSVHFSRATAKQALWDLCCHVDLEPTLIIGFHHAKCYQQHVISRLSRKSINKSVGLHSLMHTYQ